MSDDGRKRGTPTQQRFYLVNVDENLPETGQLKHGKLGRDFCLFMQPAEFLLLTPRLGFYDSKKKIIGEQAGIYGQDIKTIEEAIGWLKGSGTGVLNLWLGEREFNPDWLKTDGEEIPRFVVNSHDGRHRAAAALILGIERVPVKIRIDGDISFDTEVSDFFDSDGNCTIMRQWNLPTSTWPSNKLYLKCVKELRHWGWPTLYRR